ncbi:1,4-dihydroxy-6-naphthoate synthase [Thermodesulfobacterium sp. TA1]|uniref:1,4-dihydroxy-6-naphthoate synthase n=1 Tax=Thermodesulfobacterium sp. TA1 TaxID=2234087 RepID=UPI0012323E1F|nr:1,4-dihydroxy-6-naphthoate synthase [Thermodesulfobacterium sp. TA1]QER41323.1 1,4-dihydroxy-6-naphthoate synthase [Thermodesulfobacterium sp. TA1]
MSEKPLTIALSPCPNDVFILSGLLLKRINPGINLTFRFEDIETLNRLGIEGHIPVIKTSFAIWDKLYQTYELMPVGAALGFGAGPLIVSLKPYSPEDFPNLTIAIPGEHTTAHLLFRFFYQGEINKVFVRYDQIIPFLLEKKADLGVLIHEGRFVYQKHGLYQICDLGEYWERQTVAPVPLGGFFIKKDLSPQLKQSLVNAFRESLLWAKEHWKEVLPLLKFYAQELDEEVIKLHVDTYVTEHTFNLKEGALKGLTYLKNLLKIEKDINELVWRG